MNFSYTMGVASAPMLCTRETFDTLVHSPAVKEHIQAYRNGNESAKKKLPAFCFHATFKGNRRISSEAIPSSLVMVDIDHATDEEMKRYIDRAMPKPEDEATTEVMLIHVTPSGKGLRFVIKATSNPGYEKCNSISDYQHVFAEKIGASARLDTVTTDEARLSFCPAADDIVYLNDRLWTDVPEKTQFGEPFFQKTGVAPPPGVPPAQAAPAAAPEQEMQLTYKGLSLTDIFAAYFEQTGGMPEKGERNTRFYEAARVLRYICDFNPAVIAAHLPQVGLNYDEVYAVCQNACQSLRATQMPGILQHIIQTLSDEKTDHETAGKAEDEDRNLRARLLDSLPPLFKRFTSLYPESFTEAIVLAMLPILGVLATRLRARYFIDNETHSPSFMTIVTAEQASGKSFTRRLMRVLLKTIYAEDEANHEVERAYREQLKLCRNTKKQPEKPKVVVRIVPPTVSVAKLLERMDQAEGQHILSFAEELDTVIKSNGAGAWSQKNDMHRQAFDNSQYGQDYMSDNTYSVTLPIYYNLLFCGTPRQTSRYFKDVENGLVSRFCFASLPDQFGAEIPQYGALTDKDVRYIDNCVQHLREAEGEVDLSYLAEPLREWLEEQRVRAVMDNDRARDTFRKRAAVIGFRAAMTVTPLCAKSAAAKKKLTEFALCIAGVVLKNQMEFAGKELNEVLENSQFARQSQRQLPVFESLPDEFTMDEVAAELRKRGRRTPAKNVVYRWRKAGLIEATEFTSVFRKVKK